jgi:hypothetical protein
MKTSEMLRYVYISNMYSTVIKQSSKHTGKFPKTLIVGNN